MFLMSVIMKSMYDFFSGTQLVKNDFELLQVRFLMLYN